MTDTIVFTSSGRATKRFHKVHVLDFIYADHWVSLCSQKILRVNVITYGDDEKHLTCGKCIKILQKKRLNILPA